MFKFYDVDANYIHYLQQFEPKVPRVEYSNNSKFVCGVVLSINDIDYYAPVSHFNKPQQTNFPIRHKGNVISTIRFCFMFPAISEVLHEIDFAKIAITDLPYAQLLNIEYEYCKINIDNILSKATKVYTMGTNPEDWNYRNCCNFKLLEQHYKDYNSSVTY